MTLSSEGRSLPALLPLRLSTHPRHSQSQNGQQSWSFPARLYTASIAHRRRANSAERMPLTNTMGAMPIMQSPINFPPSSYS